MINGWIYLYFRNMVGDNLLVKEIVIHNYRIRGRIRKVQYYGRKVDQNFKQAGFSTWAKSVEWARKNKGRVSRIFF